MPKAFEICKHWPIGSMFLCNSSIPYVWLEYTLIIHHKLFIITYVTHSQYFCDLSEIFLYAYIIQVLFCEIESCGKLCCLVAESSKS